MNVYRVVSEPLEYQVIIDPEIGGPWEQYCIAEMVAAPSPGRAKWFAWQSDDGFGGSWNGGDVADMPKFSVKMIRRNEDWPEGLLSTGFYHLWTERLRPYLLPEVALIEDYMSAVYEADFGDCLHCGEHHG